MFRLGTDKPIEVDTVMFGFFRREVFSKIGYFDEELIRNQDDEFNARLKRAGGKIFLVPGLSFKYYARENFSKLWKMYYQYGYFKPLVNTKIKRPSNLRQLVPGIFVLFLISTLISGILYSPLLGLFISVLFLYILVNMLFSTQLSKGNGFKQLVMNMVGFMTLHFSYGIGYLKGIVDFVLLGKKTTSTIRDMPTSR
jgi:GT2 family glycosyltransferase